ncbi:MAG: site-specific integrase [Bryobacterales bacterium]|nr:site-specific integrase [Bryobacterales bacterium]
MAGIEKRHPHRFRHTFAGDMIRAGVSLPALMRLMGHSDIQTTMVYLALTAEDVYREYARAVARRLTSPPRV